MSAEPMCQQCGGPLFVPSAAPNTARLYCSRACQGKAAYQREVDRSAVRQPTLVFLDIAKYYEAVRLGDPRFRAARTAAEVTGAAVVIASPK